jgi:lipopolysaccharide/colanic/teichoic acid biosynthesis glycosyltransferase
MKSFAGVQGAVLQKSPLAVGDKMNRLAKRIFDLFVSLVAIILLSPILLIIAAAIKLNDKGPAVFKQERAGKDGKPFIFYKFRTMKVNVDPYGQSPKSGDDPRLIKCGKFLREYSLDELPQLFNVLKGNMSFVGPRPLYVSQIRELSDQHKKRLQLKPGLTGMSQIYLRSDLISQESLDMEVEYVQKQNSWLDIKILFLTLAVVLGKKGVYEEK